MAEGTQYSPFDKSFQTISVDDLGVLRTVKEGWYVEYKRELPSAKVVAKSVSSFANTYGGWFFIGVEEKSKDDPVAGAFPGIPNDEIDGALQCVRQAIATHLSAAPFIETKVVKGPSAEISLPDDRSIICVRVPWNVNAPFIHSSGQVYRRVADGSEPRPETDRHLLDQLWRRSDDLKRQYRKWVKRDPEFSKAEAQIPYVRLLLAADLWQERDVRLDLNLRQVRSMFNANPAPTKGASLPFDTVHQTNTGFVARQAKGNDPTALTMTWGLRYNLASDVIIPLNVFEGTPTQVWSKLAGYDHGGEFYEILANSGCETIKVVDLNMLFSIMAGVVERQEAILASAGWTSGYHMKARVLNAWRTVPFLDTAYFIRDCKAGGFPLGLSSVVTSPPGNDPDTFTEVSLDNDEGDIFQQQVRRAIALFVPVAQAFGVTIVVDEDEIVDLVELNRAATRAYDNQSARNNVEM